MALLRHSNIGGIGTFLINSKRLPGDIKRAISKAKDDVKANRSNWADTVTFIVPTNVDNRLNEILVMLWIDQNVVSMMSTVHTLHRDIDFVFRVRKRPRGSSTNARSARLPFGSESTARLPIPKIIDDYNKFMGGVDSFDQRRAVFDMRLKSRRTWIPLFQFLLDLALVNSVLLSRELGIVPSKGTAEIRMAMARDLVTESRALRNAHSQVLPFVTPNVHRQRNLRVRSVLPQRRLDTALHSVIRSESRSRCELCKIKLLASKKSSQGATKSFMRCTYCNVALCAGKNRPCFENFHSKDFTNSNLEQ